MKIPVIKFVVDNLEVLRQQLIQLQDSINRVLAGQAFDNVSKIEFRARNTDFPKYIKNPAPRPCWGLRMVYLRNLTDDTDEPTNDVFVDWLPEAGSIKIRAVNGLTAGDLYEMRFIAYA